VESISDVGGEQLAEVLVDLRHVGRGNAEEGQVSPRVSQFLLIKSRRRPRLRGRLGFLAGWPVAESGELAMRAAIPPGGILRRPAHDQGADTGRNGWAACPRRPGGPAAADELAMPAQDRCRCEEESEAATGGEQSGESSDHGAVGLADPRPGCASSEHSQSMAQDEDLDGSPTPSRACRRPVPAPDPARVHDHLLHPVDRPDGREPIAVRGILSSWSAWWNGVESSGARPCAGMLVIAWPSPGGLARRLARWRPCRRRGFLGRAIRRVRRVLRRVPRAAPGR
jgi:hypothetical protein